MNSRERVMASFAFQRPDRIPRFDKFWIYPEDWKTRLGPADGMSDISIWVPNEGTFPTRARVLKEDAEWKYIIDSWGRTVRKLKKGYFSELLEVPIPLGTDPDRVDFDPVDLDCRFEIGGSLETASRRLNRDKESFCVFGKTGGPFLRTCQVRGEEQFLMDIAGDPEVARVLVDKMADHLIGIAREILKRWSLEDTGIWIYDDMGYNTGPMFSPKSFEDILLPAYRKMIKAYKEAGAKYVALHSDGNILPILDMLVDAGIDGLNPLERRTGMDPVKIRQMYPDLVLIGGMCNTDTLINGPTSRIEKEAKELIDMGREGGFIIGTHSISPEIPLSFFEAYDKVCRTYGDWDN